MNNDTAILTLLIELQNDREHLRQVVADRDREIEALRGVLNEERGAPRG